MADIITPFTPKTYPPPRMQVVNVREMWVPRCPICNGPNYLCVT